MLFVHFVLAVIIAHFRLDRPLLCRWGIGHWKSTMHATASNGEIGLTFCLNESPSRQILWQVVSLILAHRGVQR